jgi:hypothetical protein
VTLADSLLAEPGATASFTADVVETPDPAAAQLSQALAASFGPAGAAIIHYGSHAQRSGAKAESAFDFFVIVSDYDAAYAALAASRGIKLKPATAARLNRLLAPNVIAIRFPEMTPPALAKCAVLSQDDLALATSAQAPDHFTQGRLFQHVQLAWTATPAQRHTVLAALAACRARTCDWGLPFLPAGFDRSGFIRALLARSFEAEIRPETADRIETLTGAQRDSLAPVYDELLQRLEHRNIIEKVGPVYRLAAPVPARERRHWERYFRRSKRRATMRWGKYVLLYDDWLDYVVQKVARRSGTTVELTSRERRWPLIFLWPRVFRYLRTRPQRRRST